MDPNANNKGISIRRPLDSGAEISYFGVSKMVNFDPKRPFLSRLKLPKMQGENP